MKCPTDICIICCGLSCLSALNPPLHKFPPKRQDSLHCHLIDFHLVHARDGISSNWESCRNVPRFTKIPGFLAHAATVHSYDVNIKLYHLPQVSQLNCSDISSREVSLEAGRQGTETPASIDFEMANIDPHLLEPCPVTITKPSPCRSGTEISAPSFGSMVTNSDPSLTEVPFRRSMRGTAKAADLAPVPKSVSQPQHAIRSSRRHHHAEEQLRGLQQEKGRPGNMKASVKKPPLC